MPEAVAFVRHVWFNQVMRILAGTFFALLAAAQSPQFEVASIKPSAPPIGGRIRMQWRGGPGTDDPGLFTCENWPVSQLIVQAFDLKDYQISGPDWMASTRFTISAKIAEGTTEARFHLMMQNLLADRLKPKIPLREERNASVRSSSSLKMAPK